MKKTTQNNGITLVALVITIIVLLILAMVTINILINQGIIGHANNAVRGYEVAEEKELIGLGYQNYKMDKLHDSDALLTVDGANGGEGIPKDDDTWYITFDKTGHTYALTDNGNIEAIEGGVWTKNNDGSYTKGDVTLKVGDYVAYDPMDNPTGPTTYTSYSLANKDDSKNNGRTSGYTEDQTFDASSYNKGWKVLSIKGTTVQLIAADSVGVYRIKGKEGYQYTPDELQAISTAYGTGKGATSGRNLTVEEINKITGYNPLKTGNGDVHEKGRFYEYGNEVTYYWKGGSAPYGIGKNGYEGNLESHASGFYYFDGSNWIIYPQSTTAKNTDTGREKITTVTSLAYEYYVSTLTNRSSEENIGIPANSNEYRLLFTTEFWLASNAPNCLGGSIHYEVFKVYCGWVQHTSGLYRSNATVGSNSASSCIRPVITLSPKAQIKAESGQDGTSAAKAYSLVME